MTEKPEQLTLADWDARSGQLRQTGESWAEYCRPLSEHLGDGDLRLTALVFDNAPASFRLWNFLLSEEDRLRQEKEKGGRLVGTMKDLGTVPVLAFSFDKVTAFYPDGAWWIPCITELDSGMLEIASRLGVDESFCPVRAMLGAFATEDHFPIPDLLICSAGAVCDDFSAIAQRLNGMGFPILWWEIPHRRHPDKNEKSISLPGGFIAPETSVLAVKKELRRVVLALEELTGQKMNDDRLRQGIRKANQMRRLLKELRDLAYRSTPCPLPALEMLIAEMLAIHFCSDQNEAIAVIEDLLQTVHGRMSAGVGYGTEQTAKIFWVNPVADLRVMNLLERCDGRICGTEYLFSHALDPIPEDIDPMEALARMALADPMVGPVADRAERISRDILHFGAEAVVISRIPGASHCAFEGEIIGQAVSENLGLPVLEIEIPPLADALTPSLQTRLEALIETVKEKRLS